MNFEIDWARYETLLTILAILVGTIILTRLTRWLLMRWTRKFFQGDRSSATAISFLRNAVSAFFLVVALIGIIYAIPSLRSLAAGLTAGAGIIAAIAAFASQEALSNIIGGIFIVVFRPFRVNDRIIYDVRYEGFIEDITLRHTVMRDYENKRIVIPNALISRETIINCNFRNELVFRFVEVPLSYGSDLDEAIRIIQAEAEAHPRHSDRRSAAEKEAGDPAVPVRVIRFTDSGAVLRVYLWGDMGDTFVQSCDLRATLIRRFAEAGIRLGVPHRLTYSEPIEVAVQTG